MPCSKSTSNAGCCDGGGNAGGAGSLPLLRPALERRLPLAPLGADDNNDNDDDDDDINDILLSVRPPNPDRCVAAAAATPSAAAVAAAAPALAPAPAPAFLLTNPPELGLRTWRYVGRLWLALLPELRREAAAHDGVATSPALPLAIVRGSPRRLCTAPYTALPLGPAPLSSYGGDCGGSQSPDAAIGAVKMQQQKGAPVRRTLPFNENYVVR